MPDAQEVASPREPDWFAPGLSFACTQCGNCCSGAPGVVRFTDAEARAIAMHLGLDEVSFRRRYTHRRYGVLSLEERVDRTDPRHPEGRHDCVFLVEMAPGRRGCSIYPVRPQQCRTWPFWPSLLRSEACWDEARRGCPGMKSKAQGAVAGADFVPAERIRIIRDGHDFPV